MFFYRILFVFIPIGILFGLIFFLDTTKTVSERERRRLAVLPETFLFKSIETEKYLADHIPLRDKFLDFYFETGLGVDAGTGQVLVGKNKWLFLRQHPTTYNFQVIPSYQNRIVFSEKEKNQVKHNLSKVVEWAKEHNIRVYFTLPPDKMRVYSRFVPSYILRDNAPSVEDQMAALMPAEITFIPLEKRMQKLSYADDLLYYKTESHWNEEGAFATYQWLMDEIVKDFPKARSVTKDDFNIEMINKVYVPFELRQIPRFTNGNLFLKGMTGYDKVFYPHYTFKKQKEIKSVRTTQFRFSEYPNGAPYNVYLIGDSYSTFFIPYLSATFQRVEFHRFNGGGKHTGIRFNKLKSDILKNKTTILIFAPSDLKGLMMWKLFW